MKTKIVLLLFFLACGKTLLAQSVRFVSPRNEISDNLDLRAVASIFGDSDNLQDFERRLNDPQLRVSNLDLNNDNQVDYLRVIETVSRQTHLIVIQAVLDRTVFQDIATIDVERDAYNQVHVQVVGDAYLYGSNYIYEPVYYSRPPIYSSFWVNSYRPYCSTWRWNFYPNFFVAWNPFPVYRYRNYVTVCVNNNNEYQYVNARRSYRAQCLSIAVRSNGYERAYPDYSFSRRNANCNNRYDLDQVQLNSRYTDNSSYRVPAQSQRFGETRNYSDRNYFNASSESNQPVRSDYGTLHNENQRMERRSDNANRLENHEAIRRDYGLNRSESIANSTRDYGWSRSENRESSARDYRMNRSENQQIERRTEELSRSDNQRRDFNQERNARSREQSNERYARGG